METIPMMIAKNISAEAEAVKDYLPLLDSFDSGSSEYNQIKEIIADELSHGLVLTAMLVKSGFEVADDAKEAIKFLAKRVH